MSKPHLDFTAIRSITAKLAPAETDLSSAIAANAELMASIIRAQAPMNVSPLVTQDVVATLSAANADLVAGMGKTAMAHQLLADLRDRVGLRMSAYGGGMWKGEASQAPGEAPEGGTTVVSLAATA